METTLTSRSTASGPAADWPLRAGYLQSAVSVFFLLVDGIMKLFRPEAVISATTNLGFDESVIVPLGVLLTAITILYAIPRTAVLGAVLLTGYLGGAVATHVRVGSGAFPVLFPVIVGLFVWGGIYFRDERVAALLPFRRP